MVIPHPAANGTSQDNAQHFDEDAKPAVDWTAAQEFPHGNTLCTDEDNSIATTKKFFTGRGSGGHVVTGKARRPHESTLATDCY